MIRTIFMGFLALAAIVAVLAAVFLVGLARIKLADRPAPVAVAPIQATQPAVPAPSPPAAMAVAAPDPLPPVSIQAIEFPAEKARLSGSLKLENDPAERPHAHHRPSSPPEAPPAVRQAITYFHDESDAAEWAATIPKPGLYEVDLVYASPGPKGKSESCILSIGDQDLHADTLHTRGRETYQVLTVGNLTLAPGPLTIRFRLAEKSRGSQLRLRALRLIPAA